MRALYSQSLIEAPHDELNIGVRRKEFQVLRRVRWSRPAAALLLCGKRDRQKKQKGE
jgi:hypothetical protein